MPRVKISVDESLIYFEDKEDSWDTHEVEVSDETLRGWRQAMDHADRVQTEMRELYNAAVQPAEIPPEKPRWSQAFENEVPVPHKPHWSEVMENPGWVRPDTPGSDDGYMGAGSHS